MAIIRKHEVISPLYKDDDGILYNGKIFSSIYDFIDKVIKYDQTDLAEIVLGKFTQHIYYQKQLMAIISTLENSKARIVFEDVPGGASIHEDLVIAYQQVACLLKMPSMDELNTIFDRQGLRHIPHGEKRDTVMRFYKSALPFKGKNQALFLTLVYANKLVYGCIYDRRVEKMLLSLNCDGP